MQRKKEYTPTKIEQKYLDMLINGTLLPREKLIEKLSKPEYYGHPVRVLVAKINEGLVARGFKPISAITFINRMAPEDKPILHRTPGPDSEIDIERSPAIIEILTNELFHEAYGDQAEALKKAFDVHYKKLVPKEGEEAAHRDKDRKPKGTRTYRGLIGNSRPSSSTYAPEASGGYVKSHAANFRGGTKGHSH